MIGAVKLSLVPRLVLSLSVPQLPRFGSHYNPFLVCLNFKVAQLGKTLHCMCWASHVTLTGNSGGKPSFVASYKGSDVPLATNTHVRSQLLPPAKFVCISCPFPCSACWKYFLRNPKSRGNRCLLALIPKYARECW
eukprot:5694157-Amphidinium_carterae.2